MRTIGIDFGTCNIKAAEKKANKDMPVSLKLGRDINNSMIPNVIGYEAKDADYTYYLGKLAENKQLDENDMIRHIKSHLQENSWRRKLSFGKEVVVSDVVDDIMKFLYNEVYGNNRDEEIRTTITIPVNFSIIQKNIVESAARKAGFKVDGIITEPFAALFFLMHDYFDKKEKHNVLIFDFGGGSLDFCLAEVKEKSVTTLSTIGISYGGNSINSDILENILKVQESDRKLLEQAAEVEEKVRISNNVRVMEAIEQLKAEMFYDDEDIDLDEKHDYIVTFLGAPGFFKEIAAKDIYKMFDNQEVTKRVEKLLDNLFSESDINPKDINDVFMVGGSSSIPYFRSILENYFEKHGCNDINELFSANDDIDREERLYSSVALGAALYANLLASGNVKIDDRIPFMVYSKDEKGRKWTKVRNDSFASGAPAPWAKLTDTMKENRKIQLYQNIFEDKDKEVYLGDVFLSDEIAANAKFYRIAIGKRHNISVEFGAGEIKDDGDYDKKWSLDFGVKK